MIFFQNEFSSLISSRTPIFSKQYVSITLKFLDKADAIEAAIVSAFVFRSCPFLSWVTEQQTGTIFCLIKPVKNGIFTLVKSPTKPKSISFMGLFIAE